MRGSSLQAVSVAVMRTAGRDDDREALLAWATEVASDALTVRRRCRDCGADDHGKPTASVRGQCAATERAVTPVPEATTGERSRPAAMSRAAD